MKVPLELPPFTSTYPLFSHISLSALDMVRRLVFSFLFCSLQPISLLSPLFPLLNSLTLPSIPLHIHPHNVIYC